MAKRDQNLKAQNAFLRLFREPRTERKTLCYWSCSANCPSWENSYVYSLQVQTNLILGGYTVFPFVGAWVRPVRGSVVVWWNMDQAGGYDSLVKHGGCPVIIGSKWITNKWVRANGQMFRRPCPRSLLLCWLNISLKIFNNLFLIIDLPPV